MKLKTSTISLLVAFTLLGLCSIYLAYTRYLSDQTIATCPIYNGKNNTCGKINGNDCLKGTCVKDASGICTDDCKQDSQIFIYVSLLLSILCLGGSFYTIIKD
jgi:hypothetical protein